MDAAKVMVENPRTVTYQNEVSAIWEWSRGSTSKGQNKMSLCVTRFLAKFGGIASATRSIQIVEALRVFLHSVKPPHTFDGSGYYPSLAEK